MVQAHPDMMSAEHHLGFFQRKNVQSVLPFLTSLALHSGLIILALMTYKVVTIVRTVHSEAQIAPSVIQYDGPVDPKSQIPPELFKGIGKDPTREPLQNYEFENVDPKSMKFAPGSASQINLNPGGSEGADASLIGLNGGSFGHSKGHSLGDSLGDGTREAIKGPFGRIGPPGGGSKVLPRPDPNARKIIYVCDATGSMTSVFSGLRRELGNEINNLRVGQFFNVIFFSDDKVLSLSPSLVYADAAGKTKAAAFFNDVSARGLTNPLPAIRAAFAQQPDVIYVLTDGFDQIDDLSSVVKEFDTLNKDHKVQVHTILIGSGEQKELAETLQTIAKKNHGMAKIVSKDEF